MADLASLALSQSLWVAFHDSIIEMLRFDGNVLTIQLRTNFPHPPAESAKRACLQFSGVTALGISSSSESIPLERLLAAFDDDTVDIMNAAWSPGSPVRFAFEAVFWNDELGAVLIDVTTAGLDVTADGHPSSLEEWLKWGTAGWEKFAMESSAKQDTPEQRPPSD